MIELSQSKPTGWDETVFAHSATTASSEWLQVVSAIGSAEHVYLWDRGGEDGIPATIFRRGPFKIGYLGFPLGLMISGRPTDDGERRAIVNGMGKFDLLVIPETSVGRASMSDLPFYSEPESAIRDLQAWDAEVSPQSRRRTNIRRARRIGLSVRDASAGDAEFIHDVYRDTVAIRGGRARYSLEYFTAFLRLGERDPLVRSLIMQTGDGTRQSFALALMHGSTGVYMHGGFDRRLELERPVDLGLLAAVEWARSRGARCFDFQRSPSDQPELIAYKERWGGVTTAEHKTYVSGRIPVVAKALAWARGRQWNRTTRTEGPGMEVIQANKEGSPTPGEHNV